MEATVPKNEASEAGNSGDKQDFESENLESSSWNAQTERPETHESQFLDKNVSETAKIDLQISPIGSHIPPVKEFLPLGISQTMALQGVGSISSTDSLSPVTPNQEINICDLPECVLLRIFHCVDIRILILVIRKTCRYWHYLSYDRSLWKVLKLDNGGFGEKMGDVSFLKMLAPICDLVEEIVFGFTMLLTDESFMHRDLHLSNIKSLDFSLTNVTTSAIVYLTDKYPKLTSLNLNHCSYINIYKCLDFVSQFKDLKYLSFEDFACPADDHKLNEKILKTFQSCQKLTCCDIYATELSDMTLAGIFECSPKLKELDLTGADKLTYSGFQTLKKDIHCLTHLSIAYTMIDDKGLKVIAENSPKLKLLNIMSCVYISDVGIGYVATHCKELESFLVNKTDPEEKGCCISSYGLETIALGCPRLKTLCVSYCPLMDDKCIIAVAANCPGLTELRLAGCLGITDTSLMALGKHSRYLRDLEVSECALLTSKGISFLMARCKWLQCLSLETCHKVSEICISDNLEPMTLGDIDDHKLLATQSVEAGGQSKEDLQAAQADANQDSDSERSRGITVTILMQLQNHSHLQSLHLSFCSKITNDTIIEISKHCPDLQELSLRGCHLITDIAIASLVRSCEFLRILDLSGGSSFFSMKISNVSLSAIAHDSKYIERLMVSKNKLINLSGLEALFNRCKSLESLELTVGEPMYASFSGVMSLVNNINDRIVKVANHAQIIANKQSGNLHIEFYPNPENKISAKASEDVGAFAMSCSSMTE